MTNTFEAARVADVLTRLYAEAEASNAKVREIFGDFTPEQRAQRMSDPTSDYRGFYRQAKDLYLAVSKDTARLLYMLTRARRARWIVEFGTSFGISTLHLAAGLRDNGGGKLIGSELEASKAAQARANLAAAGLDDLAEIREGDALDTLARDLPEHIDLVLLDGHKALYARILDLLVARLGPGACIVADNADACPDYLRRVRASGSGFMSVPFADDVELTVKI